MLAHLFGFAKAIVMDYFLVLQRMVDSACSKMEKKKVEFCATSNRALAGENYFITCGDILKDAVETSTGFTSLLFGHIMSSNAK